MSWVKQNSFLAGFLGATVVAAGVLGYLLFQAKGEYSTRYSEYEQEASELNRLEGMRPYPNEENVKKLEAQRNEYVAEADKLVATASALEFEETPVSATEFQDKLRVAVDDVNQRAAARNMEVPKPFSLGFERYLTDLPRPEAAGPLARQLAAVKLAVDSVIDSQVGAIKSFTRPELPQERGAVAGEDAKKAPSGKASEVLVEKHPIEMVLFGKQPQIRNALNKIVTSDKQFFIPRLISVVNEQQEGPPRAPEGMAAPAPAAPGGDPSAPAAAPAAPGKLAEYIVGEENVEFTITLEIADFAETDAATAKANPKK